MECRLWFTCVVAVTYAIRHLLNGKASVAGKIVGLSDPTIFTDNFFFVKIVGYVNSDAKTVVELPVILRTVKIHSEAETRVASLNRTWLDSGRWAENLSMKSINSQLRIPHPLN